MFTPEITLNLIRQRRYGAKAMERRVKKCCAANLGCPYKVECNIEYDAALDALDEEERCDRNEIYHKLRDLGVGSIDARANLSMKRVRKLATQTP